MPTVIDKTPIHDDAIGWSRERIRYTRGEIDPPHQHSQGQLLFAIKGVMLVETGSKRWVIPPQRALWIPSFQEHTQQRAIHNGSARSGSQFGTVHRNANLLSGKTRFT